VKPLQRATYTPIPVLYANKLHEEKFVHEVALLGRCAGGRPNNTHPAHATNNRKNSCISAEDDEPDNVRSIRHRHVSALL
jgi:hypothetical protein